MSEPSAPSNPAAENPGAAPAAPPASHTYECGKDALNRLVDRTRHAASGARLSIEKCPDASRARAIRGAALLGGVGAACGFFARRSRLFVIATGLGGALLGALGSRYHVSFDWDPDRAFGGERGYK